MLEEVFRKLFGSGDSDQRPDNRALLKAMRAIAKSDTQHAHDEVYRRLLNAWFWVAVPEIPPALRPGASVVDADVQVGISMVKNGDGEAVLPVFTDEEALRNWDPNTPFLTITAHQLFKLALESGAAMIMVNPFDPVRKMIRPGGTIMRWEFDALAQGVVPHTVADCGVSMTFAAGTVMNFTNCPEPLPPEMLRAIVEAAMRHREIEAIFRYTVKVGDSDRPNETFGVMGVPQHRQDTVFAELMEAVRPHLGEPFFLDFMVVSPDTHEWILNEAERIYERDTTPKNNP